MPTKILSAAVIGLDAEIVEVEADTTAGELGKVVIVGLPDMAISEARERVRSAVKNSGLNFPVRKTVVNLAPADLKKHGPAYDLPIAISILSLKHHLKINFKESLFVGELSLDGEVRSVSGVLPIAAKAKAQGLKVLYVPKINAGEAKLIKELTVVPVENLKQLFDHLRGVKLIAPLTINDFNFQNAPSVFDMAHIKGQEQVKRALEIAACGAHNLLLYGPPGSGKTLLARTLPSILPGLTLNEALDVTKIYSVAGELKNNQSLITSRPFRSPHHSSSIAALVGGGTWPRPGEISLAHRGVLFLDEFTEFPRYVLENLRQPLEDGLISISRISGCLNFPAKFILVAAMNPCPCGYLGDAERNCTCLLNQVLNYRKRISGPILDRIDLHIEVPRVNFDKLIDVRLSESSEKIKERIKRARRAQAKRFKKTPFITNGEMSSAAVKDYCPLDFPSQKLLRQAVEKMNLSNRAYFRLLKLARTIADLAAAPQILLSHVAEALQYRPKER